MPDVAAALAREGVLAPEDLTRALDAARDGDVASAALRLGLAPKAALVRVLARVHGYPGVDLSRSVVPASNLGIVPANRCRAGPPCVRARRASVLARPGGACAAEPRRGLGGRRED